MVGAGNRGGYVLCLFDRVRFCLFDCLGNRLCNRDWFLCGICPMDSSGRYDDQHSPRGIAIFPHFGDHRIIDPSSNSFEQAAPGFIAQ